MVIAFEICCVKFRHFTFNTDYFPFTIIVDDEPDQVYLSTLVAWLVFTIPWRLDSINQISLFCYWFTQLVKLLC